MCSLRHGARFGVVSSMGFAVALLLAAPTMAGIPTTVGSDSRGLPTLAPILERVTPGVVNIAVRGHVATQRNPLFNDPFFKRFFNVPNQPRERAFRAAGSGVIVDAKKGYVITNNHVIRNADEITVKLRDGRQFRAKVIGADSEADIAIIQIKAKNLTAVPFGDSDKLKVGDFVIAVGNPFGLGQTVTSGIVSALGRSGLGIEGYEDFIQTDASINPGNSGGALVDLRGQLIGINTAIVGPSGGNVGIGFAIPIDMARAIMKQLIKNGKVRRGLLGVQIQNLTPDIASALGIDARSGAIVAKVVPGTAAMKAGIKVGDVVIAVDGKPVRGAADLKNKIGMVRVGDPVKLTMLRGNKKLSVTAILSPRPQAKLKIGNVNSRLAGAVFGQVKGNGSGRPKGVEVLKSPRGSAAWMAGLRKGDIITSVDRRPIQSTEDLRTAIRANHGVLLLRILRGGAALYIAIR